MNLKNAKMICLNSHSINTMTSAAIAIMITKTTKAIPTTLSTFIMALTTISVSLTFLTMIFWISLFKRSSILILKVF